MSGKQNKKLRQLSRRQENKQLVELYDEVKATLKKLVKPAPWWIPKKVWRAMSKVFLNI